MIAAAAVCAAMAGFQNEVETSREAMLQTMHRITNIEQVKCQISLEYERVGVAWLSRIEA